MSAKVSKEITTGGHLFVKILQEKGIEFVFGTTGAGMPDIQDAMVIEKPPKWIQGLHEFPTVSAAAGYGLASEHYGVALIDRVVGTQNALGAFYAAYLNSAPLVVFASSNVPGVSIPTGEVEYHYSNDQAMFVRPWLKWSTNVVALETLEHDVAKAIYLASAEHCGPTYVTLRQDLMAKTLENCDFTSSVPLSNVAARVPDDDTCRKIIEEILSHTNPQIVVSHLGRRKSAVDCLVKLAHVLGLPVSERRVYMSFPVHDELFAGFIHTTKSPRLLDSTDLVLALEIGMLPLEKFGEAIDVIDLESDPMGRQNVVAGGEYGSTVFPAIIRANCDTAPTLCKLVKVAESMLSGPERAIISERSAKAKEYNHKLLEDWKTTSKRAYEKDALDGWSIGHVMNEHWSKEMIWVDGSISMREGLQKAIELDEPGTYFSNPSYHLGTAAGMSYGVALAYANYMNIENKGSYKIGQLTKSSKTVICTIGDGDAIFGNIDSALWTCSHYGLGVLYLILNNACWGIEWPPFEHTSKQWAKIAGDFEFLDLDNPRVDFSKIADAFGIPNARVNTAHEFEDALVRALSLVAQGKPCLIDIQMPKRTGPEPSVVP